jgi:hypothetical protein
LFRLSRSHNTQKEFSHACLLSSVLINQVSTKRICVSSNRRSHSTPEPRTARSHSAIRGITNSLVGKHRDVLQHSPMLICSGRENSRCRVLSAVHYNHSPGIVRPDLPAAVTRNGSNRLRGFQCRDCLELGVSSTPRSINGRPAQAELEPLHRSVASKQVTGRPDCCFGLPHLRRKDAIEIVISMDSRPRHVNRPQDVPNLLGLFDLNDCQCLRIAGAPGGHPLDLINPDQRPSCTIQGASRYRQRRHEPNDPTTSDLPAISLPHVGSYWSSRR